MRSPWCGLRQAGVTVACLAMLVFVVLFVSSREQGETAPARAASLGRAASHPRAAVGPLARSEALRRHVKDACRALDFRASKNLSAATLSHLLYDDEHKVIYCYIPKVSCTSWRRVLLKMTGQVPPGQDMNTLTRAEVHSEKLKRLSSSRDQEEKLRAYRKFMFVRQPFERVVSAYRDKLVGVDGLYDFHKIVGMKIEEKYRGTTAAGGHNITFREFIRYISEPGRGTPEQRNEHWLPMHELCDPCSVDYDFIGTKENLHEDADYVLKWLGVADLVGRFPESDRPVNASRHVSQYLQQLTNSAILAFYAKFLPDYLLFDYEIL